jgi:hypothetical protein
MTRRSPSQIFFALGLTLSLALPGVVCAIPDPDNLGQWDKPTEIGPDKEVPGFLVNLGPTGARAILKETSFVVKHVFSGSPADGKLKIDDEITGANGKPFGKHTFGKFYGMEPGAGYEGPIMDLGNAIEDSEGKDGTSRSRCAPRRPADQSRDQTGSHRSFQRHLSEEVQKSEKLAARAMEYLLNRKDERCGIVHEKACSAWPCSPKGKTRKRKPSPWLGTRLRARRNGPGIRPTKPSSSTEYFLQTGDKRVLPTIEENCKRLYLSQVIDPELYKDRHARRPAAGRTSSRAATATAPASPVTAP